MTGAVLFSSDVYFLDRVPAKLDWAEVATAIVTVGYLDAAVKKGTTYHYAIRARNPLGVSAPSKPVSAKPK